jgi:hypothetical protein
MHKLFPAALLCAALALSPGAHALDWNAYPYYDLVITVDGWPKMAPREDGKIDIGSFSVAAQGGGKPAIQSIELRVPLGEPAALFLREALDGRTLKFVLVEGFAKGPTKPTGRAPFAIRLSDARVTAVHLEMGYGDARVSLQAPKIEIFTATQAATGVMQPRQQYGWDSRTAGKAFDIPATKAGK